MVDGRAALRSCGTRPATAGVLLFLCYGVLSLLLDPGGYLGTDTGTKIYTLEVMDRRDTFTPDIGYWAEESDPGGSLHPVHQTERQRDGTWVGVTTLPVLTLAHPLYDAGGYRAVLLLPMLGGVAAAFAARSVSRRLRAGASGWSAFWMIGLASPLLVYSLDFWEHSLGVACILGAVAVLLSVLDDRRPRVAIAAGVLLGAGAVMRQEVLVFGLVAVAATCVTLLVQRRTVTAPVVAGAAALVGFALPWSANQVLESAVQGQSRTARSTGTASAAATGAASPSALGARVEEAAQTLLGLVSGDAVLSALLGGAVVAAVVVASRAEGRGDRGFAQAALAAAGLVYVADAAGGLGFVPGLLTAFPLAVGGLLCWRITGRSRVVLVIAVVSLPIVYFFQYLGGAPPQWGGRYTLAAGSMLGILALSHLGSARPIVLRGLVVLSALVTGLGFAWLVERTHAVDRFFEELAAEAEPVVIARQAFLLREGGAAIVGRRWLSAEDEQEFARAIDVARAVGEERFTVLEWDGPAPPDVVVPDDVREVSRETLRFVDTPVGVVTYTFAE